jgi:hypothetical protein
MNDPIYSALQDLVTELLKTNSCPTCVGPTLGLDICHTKQFARVFAAAQTALATPTESPAMTKIEQEYLDSLAIVTATKANVGFNPEKLPTFGATLDAALAVALKRAEKAAQAYIDAFSSEE